MFRVILVSIFSVFIVFPGILSAADEENYSGRYTLDEIVIEESRPELESNGRMRTIYSEELRERGVRTLDEALKLIPGLLIRTGAGGVPRIDIRGYKARHVLLLLDGVSLNSTYDGQLDPRIIPVEIIKKIKVTYGSGSSQYGSGALGGVINIITRRGEAKNEVRLQEEVGTGLKHYGSFNASGKDGDFDYFLGVTNKQRDGLELSDSFSPTNAENGGKRENSDFRNSSLFLRIGLTPSEKWQWGLTLARMTSDYGLSPLTIDNSSDIFANKIKYERVDNSDSHIFQLTTSYDCAGPWEFRLWFFQNSQIEETNGYDNAKYEGMSDPAIKGTYHQGSKVLIRGGTVQADRAMGNDSYLTVSLSTKHDEWNAAGKIRDVQVNSSLLGSIMSAGGKGTGGGSGGGGGSSGTGADDGSSGMTGTTGTTETTDGDSVSGTDTGVTTESSNTGTDTSSGTGTGGGGGKGTGAGTEKNTVKQYDIRNFENIQSQEINTLALEYNCKPIDKLNLSVSGNLCNASSDKRDDESQGEFSLGFSRDLSEKTLLHGVLARKIRFPTVQQLYDETGGNLNLKTECSMNYELGVLHEMFKNSRFGVTLFQSAVDNYIEKQDSTSRYENFDEYLFKGVEFSLNHKFNSPLTLETTLSLMDSEDQTSNSGRDELQYRPKVKCTLSGTYNFHNGSLVHLEMLHLNGQHYYSRTLPLQKASLNNITVTNLRVSKPIRYYSLVIYAGADNVFDQNYETAYGVPAAGRFAYTGIQATF
ncbi:MAG: TonB-dependent receptor plug domain-containing protein [Candidatus Riflebacteria bacterium]|nr:TonB-dependent receptor plug domain-containing protein [Candidatus Riflebacteria bacterium]